MTCACANCLSSARTWQRPRRRWLRRAVSLVGCVACALFAAAVMVTVAFFTETPPAAPPPICSTAPTADDCLIPQPPPRTQTSAPGATAAVPGSDSQP
jgi:hypothetical protein